MNTNKKMSYLFLMAIQVATGVVTGFLGLIVGTIFGALIGGNFGFFEWKGLIGYESAGVIFGFLFMCLGAWAGALLIAIILKQPSKNPFSGFFATLFCFVLILIFYSTPNGNIVTYAFLVISAVLSAIGLNARAIKGIE